MTKRLICFMARGLILALSLIPWCSADLKANPETNMGHIMWEKPYQENGKIVVPGTTQASFGRFNFFCQIDEEGKGVLSTLESAGSGELPQIKTKLFILVNPNGTTTLLKERYPLLGVHEPVSLQTIVTVKSDELFSVMPKPILPNNESLKGRPASINWGKILQKGNNKYLAGKVKTANGTLELFWKSSNSTTAQLFTSESPGTKEKELYLATLPNKKTSYIYEEREPSNQKGSKYLWLIAIVKTNQLMKGFYIITQ